MNMINSTRISYINKFCSTPIRRNKRKTRPTSSGLSFSPSTQPEKKRARDDLPTLISARTVKLNVRLLQTEYTRSALEKKPLPTPPGPPRNKKTVPLARLSICILQRAAAGGGSILLNPRVHRDESSSHESFRAGRARGPFS